ncbi:hypothetical protein BD414DRAFT_43358 [Trametes punicea]|nr:hypothetical protein BD414DRAFT_43358 [Trametes punicea]
MHSSSSVFPIEIYEQIIEDIGQEALDPIDRSPLYRSRALKTLWSCALTCRAWVPKSNACLYRQLTFSQDDVIMRPLLQTLDAHPALRTLVTELTITRRNVTNTTRSSQAAVNASPFTRPDSVRCMLFPIIMAHRFPRLEHLRLNPDGDFYRGEETRGIIVHRAFLASLRTFRSVVKLSLCRVLFESYPDLEKILFAFPCLEIVALEDVRFRTNSSPRWLPGDRCYGGTVVAPPISQLVLTLVSLGVRPYERTPGVGRRRCRSPPTECSCHTAAGLDIWREAICPAPHHGL